MDKPMYCPFKSRYKTWLDFLFVLNDDAECTPDCAWAVKQNGRYWCVVSDFSRTISGSTNYRKIQEVD